MGAFVRAFCNAGSRSFCFLFAIVILPFFVDDVFFAGFASAPTSSSGGCCHQFIVFVQGSTQVGFSYVVIGVAAVVVSHAGWYCGAHFLEYCCDCVGCAWGWGIFQSTDQVCFGQLLEDFF